MIEGIPRISVLIITYKQENLIKRAINSLLTQRDYIYEICVSDDCSPDNTWFVLQEYDKQYPGLFKLHRNDPNLGIFQNIEFTWTMPTGDVIYRLAGDDECGTGWFSKVVGFIKANKIDYKKELFCIYGDHICIYPKGDSYVKHNNAIKKYPNDALKLAFRGLISNRGACFSIKVLQKYEKVSQGRSHIAEFLQDRQLQMYAQKNYYIPSIGNIYYSGIGVSAHLDEKTMKTRKQILPYAIHYMENKGFLIGQSEKAHCFYKRAMIDFRFYHIPSSLFKSIFYLFKSFDFRYSFLGDDLRSYLFAILRRLPHKKPILFK